MDAWDPFLAEFNAWFASKGGFGDYLRHFLAYYGPFFQEGREEHLFVYTKLHTEFMNNLDNAVKAWYESKGMTEEQFAFLLEYGKGKGDQYTTGIVHQLTNLFEYPSWIAYIFSLKTNSEFMQQLADQASQSGWEDYTWTTRWWEKWSDAEWEQWEQWRRLGREQGSHWQQWSDEEWERWWQEQETWNYNWYDKTEAWNRSWQQEPEITGGYGGGR